MYWYGLGEGIAIALPTESKSWYAFRFKENTTADEVSDGNVIFHFIALTSIASAVDGLTTELSLPAK